MKMATLYSGFLAVCAAAGPAFSQEEREAQSPSVMREKVREWVRAQKTLSAEAAAWEEAKRSMADLNQLRKREIAQIETLLEAAGSRFQDADARKRKLKSEREQLLGAREELRAAIDEIEEALRGQVAMFPPPLRAKIGEALERLENPEETTPLQNRFRDAVLILGAAGQFHHSLTVDSEIRDFGGVGVEVDVLYLGFSAAWYVDRAGERAGKGSPGPEGWIWVSDPGIATRVREAISMYEKKSAPGFIGLPFQPANGESNQ